MPANKKYLSNSPWIKFGKLTAAIFGSLMASVSLHMVLAIWLERAIVLSTAVYSGFIVWVMLMVVTYWISKVWHAWTLLGGIILICVIAIYCGS